MYCPMSNENTFPLTVKDKLGVDDKHDCEAPQSIDCLLNNKHGNCDRHISSLKNE